MAPLHPAFLFCLDNANRDVIRSIPLLLEGVTELVKRQNLTGTHTAFREFFHHSTSSHRLNTDRFPLRSLWAEATLRLRHRKNQILVVPRHVPLEPRTWVRVGRYVCVDEECDSSLIDRSGSRQSLIHRLLVTKLGGVLLLLKSMKSSSIRHFLRSMCLVYGA